MFRNSSADAVAMSIVPFRGPSFADRCWLASIVGGGVEMWYMVGVGVRLLPRLLEGGGGVVPSGLASCIVVSGSGVVAPESGEGSRKSARVS